MLTLSSQRPFLIHGNHHVFGRCKERSKERVDTQDFQHMIFLRDTTLETRSIKHIRQVTHVRSGIDRDGTDTFIANTAGTDPELKRRSWQGLIMLDELDGISWEIDAFGKGIGLVKWKGEARSS